jgi:transposase-like protein
LEQFHPDGLCCPRCGADTGRARHFRRTKRSQLTVYRCYSCGQAYNLYTGTPFEGKHLRPEQIISLLRGLAEGKSNPALAGELGIHRTTVYYLRRELLDSKDEHPSEILWPVDRYTIGSEKNSGQDEGESTGG